MRNHHKGKNARAFIKACAQTAGTSHLVSTLTDSGSGSLREAAASAIAGDQITFAQGLAGTIALASDLPELNAVALVNAAGITLSRTGADTLARGLAVKADTALGGALPGVIISASTAEGAYVKGVSCLGDLTLGDLAGSVSATATGSDSEAVGIELPNLLTIGNITGAVSAANSHGPAGSIIAYGGLSAGNISGTICATADASDACGLYAEAQITMRELSGAINVTGYSDAYGIQTEGYPINLGALSGTLLITSSSETATGICGSAITMGDLSGSVSINGTGSALASEGVLSMGTLSGSIKTSGAGANSGILSIGDLSMSGFAASGSITSVSSCDEAFGLFSLGALTMGSELAGTITVTATAEAFGCHCMGALALDVFSGSITAQGGGLSTALAVGGGMNLSISGTLSGVDTSGGGGGYALRSGYWDGSDWVEGEVGNTVTLLDGARLTGAVDLAGGDNTLIITGSDVTLGGAITCSGAGVNILMFQAAGRIAHPITNFSTFMKLGDGVLDLQADVALGATDSQATISEGELRLAAGLAAASVTIEGAGMVSGSGTVAGALANAGVLAPATLAVSGSLTLAAEGTLRLAVSDAAFGCVNVTGAAVLDGALEVDVDPGFTAVGAGMAILTATGGFSGDFASVSVTGGAFQATITHEAGRVLLTLNP